MSGPATASVTATTPAAPLAHAPLLQLDGVRKSYNLGQANEAEVLHGIDLTIAGGEFAALIGPSGSGKSTLLNIIGLLEPMTRGSYLLQGDEMGGLDDTALTRLRGGSIGFVFQFHHLLPAFTALENVMLPGIARQGRPSAALRKKALELLDRVGLSDRLKFKPSALSGGQQQRVAIARALCLNPRLILADEPTGNLDTEASDQVFELLRQINREEHTAFLVVTHDLNIAARCDRIVELVDGRITSERAAAPGGG